uniref:Uncharacterized protein n=1 Tax=Rhizophora mucronata TaxID=61149 RepID=A0A2P2JKD2_RHIMU
MINRFTDNPLKIVFSSQ